MIKLLDIERSFDGFIKKVYPFGCGEIQKTEMRRGFYAGVHLLICHLASFDDEEAGDKECERILAETSAFGKKVGGQIHNN